MAGEVRERCERLVKVLDHPHVPRLRVGPAVVGVDRADAGGSQKVIAHPDRVDAERLGAAGEVRERLGVGELAVVREHDPVAHARPVPCCPREEKVEEA